MTEQAPDLWALATTIAAMRQADVSGITISLEDAEWLIAAARERDEFRVDAHGYALVEAVIGQRGMTDHSTPVHIRVQNVLAEAGHAVELQAQLAAERAAPEHDEVRPAAEFGHHRAVRGGAVQRAGREEVYRMSANEIALPPLPETPLAGRALDACCREREALRSERDALRKAHDMAVDLMLAFIEQADDRSLPIACLAPLERMSEFVQAVLAANVNAPAAQEADR